MTTNHPTDLKVNSLGFAKAPQDTRVVVAMSGGVDSSVVAAYLTAQGYETIGITLQLYDHGAALQKKGACCAGQDIKDAQAVAEAINIPHYVLDYESRFRESVMEDFADTYLSGATPVPCIRCNQSVKFSDLFKTAKELNADCLATGHYIKHILGQDGPEMHRAADDTRDQSYFLFATTKAQLSYLRFPLGSLPKSKVRDMAEEYNLPVASKPDSQDICFVPNGSYANVVEKIRPGAGRAGDIVHLDGRVLGQHAGVIHYTVGQRRGLGVATGEPLYVIKVDAKKRQVIVGPQLALATAGLLFKEENWLGEGTLQDACANRRDILLKVRSTQPPVKAHLALIDDKVGLYFDAAEFGVSKGQAAVFYDLDGNRVLGGGFISETIAYDIRPEANTADENAPAPISETGALNI